MQHLYWGFGQQRPLVWCITGASGSGLGADRTLESDSGRDDQLQQDPEAEIQPAGQKIDCLASGLE